MTGKFTHLVVFVKWDNYSIKPVTKKPDDTIIHNGNFFLLSSYLRAVMRWKLLWAVNFEWLRICRQYDNALFIFSCGIANNNVEWESVNQVDQISGEKMLFYPFYHTVCLSVLFFYRRSSFEEKIILQDTSQPKKVCWRNKAIIYLFKRPQFQDAAIKLLEVYGSWITWVMVL